MEPVLRPARPADAEPIATLHVRSWRAAYADLVPAALLAGLDVDERAASVTEALATPAERTGFAVVEVDGEVRGFVRWGPARVPGEDPDRTGEVYAVYLDPDHFGTGLGRPLLEHACATLATDGFADAVVRVLDGNERAIRFYERAGFRLEGDVEELPFRGFQLPHRRMRRARS